MGARKRPDDSSNVLPFKKIMADLISTSVVLSMPPLMKNAHLSALNVFSHPASPYVWAE